MLLGREPGLVGEGGQLPELGPEVGAVLPTRPSAGPAIDVVRPPPSLALPRALLAVGALGVTIVIVSVVSSKF